MAPLHAPARGPPPPTCAIWRATGSGRERSEKLPLEEGLPALLSGWPIMPVLLMLRMGRPCCWAEKVCSPELWVLTVLQQAGEGGGGGGGGRSTCGAINPRQPKTGRLQHRGAAGQVQQQRIGYNTSAHTQTNTQSYPRIGPCNIITQQPHYQAGATPTQQQQHKDTLPRARAPT